MSFRIYLKADALAGSREFKRQWRTSGRIRVEEETLFGARVSWCDGQQCLEFDGAEDVHVRDEVYPFIDRVSLREVVSAPPQRRRGRYTYKDASATLDNYGNENRYELWIWANDPGSAVVLYHLIRSGQILPTESWEARQISSIQGLVGRVLSALRPKG